MNTALDDGHPSFDAEPAGLRRVALRGAPYGCGRASAAIGA